ncbi:MAG: dihydrolipoyl dehydrogenase [Candidatus Marinimicrobia bacterium]|nr:dihydrolipoyl dehydrogenase [Candidatus Neomarinimicrobiota bacterium]
MRSVHTVIIGAGSAGLSALRQVRQETDDYILVNDGPLGTTCARTGCMPSKVLVEIARDYHRRRRFDEIGIAGAEALRCDVPAVLRRVRALRDRFVSGMIASTRELAGDRLVAGRASFLAANEIQVGAERIHARQIIIATGSHPVLPQRWRKYAPRIRTTDDIFEQADLPPRIAVIGLGPVGLELGQALNRLGIHAPGFSLLETIGGLTDPRVNRAAREAIGGEMTMILGAPAEIEPDGDQLRVCAGGSTEIVDQVLLAMGVKPNIAKLGLENLGVPLNERGLPAYDQRTAQVAGLPVYLAGDVNGCRPILHEALDEGFIAGGNAAAGSAVPYCRRTPLRMVFSDPQIATVGQTQAELKSADVVVGEADFSEQSRAVAAGRNQGLLRIYIERRSGRVMGAEMAVPDGEHLAHILALAVQQKMTVFEMLQMPFYHPTIEEGLSSALRQAARYVPGDARPAERLLCESRAEPAVC